MSANQYCFDQPELRKWYLDLAHGFDPRPLSSGGGGFRGGLGFVTEVKIPAGSTLFRIGHSNYEQEANLSSPWWLLENSFYEVLSAAERSSGELEGVFRMKCAVAHAFGRSDTVFQVRTNDRLRAFGGRGRYVEDTAEGFNAPWVGAISKQQYPGQVWMGASEIMQVFIPGLRDRDNRPTALASSAISLVERFKVSEYIPVRRRRADAFSAFGAEN